MNNFKKIGLTALAGSLVAVSANAIEMSVSGNTSVSYTSASTATAAAGGHHGRRRLTLPRWRGLVATTGRQARQD